jgi:hypothetical protein
MRLRTRMIVALAVTVLAALVFDFVSLRGGALGSRRGAARRPPDPILTNFIGQRSLAYEAG